MQINFSTSIALACAVLVVSCQLEWTNGQFFKELVSFQERRRELAKDTKQAKSFDKRADNLDNLMAQDRKNGMPNEAMKIDKRADNLDNLIAEGQRNGKPKQAIAELEKRRSS